MRIHVDHDQCFGYGRCIDIAPNTFSLDENGLSVVGDLHDSPKAVRDAAWACPMQAIEVAADGDDPPSRT